VRDVADDASAKQRADVYAVLVELGINADAEPDRLLEAWNKVDLLKTDTRARVENESARESSRPCLVSAAAGLGLKKLLGEIETRLNRSRTTVDLALGHDDGALSNWVYENCEVLQRSDLGDGVTQLRVRVAPEKRHVLARLAGPARLTLAVE
jgi:GTP-binding protein HflX